jgi:heptosyltransferase-2
LKDVPPVTRRYLDTLKHLLDAEVIAPVPELYSNDYAKEDADKLITGLNIPANSKLICIVPSSKHFTKTYPPENYIELINKFDKNKFSFILIGKGNDKVNIEKIKSTSGENVYNLCDKLNLLELYEVMKKCDLVISGDTGPMHIAESAGVPIIMLAGSSVKEFGFYPTSPPAPLQRQGEIKIFEVDGLPCRPCSHIGKDHCPKGHFKCMKDITTDMIYNEIITGFPHDPKGTPRE